MSKQGPGAGVLPRALMLAAVAVVSLMSGNAWAHVGFDGFETGATFVAGTTAEIRWVDLIAHDTTAYHLSFIRSAGAAEMLIADLPATEHGYLWQVPATPCSDCALTVVQDNSGTDYSDTRQIMIVSEGTAGSGSGGAVGTGGAAVTTGGTVGTGGAAVTTGGTVGTGGSAAGMPAAGAGTAPTPVSRSTAADEGCSMALAPHGPDALALAWLAAGMALWRRRRRLGH